MTRFSPWAIPSSAGGAVTSTIRKGIVDAEQLSGTPELLIYGMLAALLAAGTWLLIASRNPASVLLSPSTVSSSVDAPTLSVNDKASNMDRTRMVQHLPA